MSVNTRVFKAPPEAVFTVLTNGWLFPVWVVGASRMRTVDGHWPSIGAEIHHSVGLWPVLIDDTTSLLEWDPPRRALMQARLWPIGEVTVALDVAPTEDGCLVTMTETPANGPIAKLPAPTTNLPMKVRNVETLRRLSYLAEGRAS